MPLFASLPENAAPPGGPSPLSEAERELILAFAAGRAAFMRRLVEGHGFIPLSKDAAKERAQPRSELSLHQFYPNLPGRSELMVALLVARPAGQPLAAGPHCGPTCTAAAFPTVVDMSATGHLRRLTDVQSWSA